MVSRPTKMTNPYEALVNKAGKPVYLKLNSTPCSRRGSREGHGDALPPTRPSSTTIAGCQDNIKKVNDATDGKVGYLHVPDMFDAGAERVRQALLSATAQRRR